uniref:Uncharacterized protein n=1 Tax=Nelumbo nucifera TaxID=4432 RepID=A0A822Y7G9_NELNU|nr:TPA_asm: hypothetical protein HUJ06_029918 [Nelumbo nucifera]
MRSGKFPLSISSKKSKHNMKQFSIFLHIHSNRAHSTVSTTLSRNVLCEPRTSEESGTQRTFKVFTKFSSCTLQLQRTQRTLQLQKSATQRILQQLCYSEKS